MTSESLCTNPIKRYLFTRTPPCVMVDLPRPPTVEELIATVAFYGMAEIPADLLACLEETAADLAEDDGTGWQVRSAFPYRSTRLAG